MGMSIGSRDGKCQRERPRNDTGFYVSHGGNLCPFFPGFDKSLRSECNNDCPPVVDMPKAKRSEGIHPVKSSLSFSFPLAF